MGAGGRPPLERETLTGLITACASLRQARVVLDEAHIHHRTARANRGL